jgi:hypothetical protein
MSKSPPKNRDFPLLLKSRSRPTIAGTLKCDGAIRYTLTEKPVGQRAPWNRGEIHTRSTERLLKMGTQKMKGETL